MIRTVFLKPDRWDWQDKHRIVWVSIAKLEGLVARGPCLVAAVRFRHLVVTLINAILAAPIFVRTDQIRRLGSRCSVRAVNRPERLHWPAVGTKRRRHCPGCGWIGWRYHPGPLAPGFTGETAVIGTSATLRSLTANVRSWGTSGPKNPTRPKFASPLSNPANFEFTA